MTKQAERTPSEANAEYGEVLVDGPDGVAFSLTPDAARRTAQALRVAARKAKRQRLENGLSSAPDEHEGGRSDQA